MANFVITVVNLVRAWRAWPFGPMFAAAMAALLAIGPAHADEALSADQVGAIEGLIRDYIMAHPEVIIESVQALRERDESSSHERAKQNLVALRDQLINDSNSPVAGNPDGDVTIVEFFDYRCSYCKASLAMVRQILEEDPGVRLVFKEFPILSPESANAAARSRWLRRLPPS